MAAGFNWNQYNGADTAETSIGTGGNLFNFMAVDSAGTTGYDLNPITAGKNSMEVYLKADFTGTFNTIDNLQFWRSTDFSPNDGLTLKWKENGIETYIPPVTATSTIAADAIPTSDPGAENVYIGGDTGGSLTAAGMSDYIVLQLQTTTAAAAGDTSLAEFTFQYDES
jgi:hypothetical protein